MNKYMLAAVLAVSVISSARADMERQALLDDNWQFTLLTDDKGNPAEELWNSVDLPHDWSILNDFTSDAATGKEGGFLPTGKGKYRKTVNIDSLNGERTLLYIEGAYMNSTVTVNGSEAGGRPYGYSSYFVDLTPFLHQGDNVIEVTVDNSLQKNTRWYSGSGLYRHVWLYTLPSVAVEPWSLYVTTPEVGHDTSIVNVAFDINNVTDNAEALSVKMTVTDMTGKVVADETTAVTATPHLLTPVAMHTSVANPALWSAETPCLYTVDVTLSAGGKVIDTVSEEFGIRRIDFSAEEGLKVNGEPVILNGGCVHHDHGLLGARSYDAAEARKVRLLKDAGFNAVRTSHNHPSPAFLRECDRQGLYVIDEAFDCWRTPKNTHDYGEHIDKWWRDDIASLVRRDRNHPSVICWSTGNEIIERKQLDAVMTARHLAGECKRLDPTRPVTSALAKWDNDWEIFDPLAEAHDIVGYNYLIHLSEDDHARAPQRVMWQTESYPREAYANWLKVNSVPYILGDFVWTAVDYLGESGLGRNFYEGQTEGESWQADMWPHHGATCGDIDILGHRRPISHYRDLLYNPSRPLYMAVREPDGYKGRIRLTMWSAYPTYESWTWPGHEGKPIEVEVISRCPVVRLYLDGSLMGEQPTGEAEGYRTVFTIDYRPGVIEARGVDSQGREVGSACLATAGEPYALRATADRTDINADNRDLSYITVEVVDRQGRRVPYATDLITLAVSGSGTLEGSGSTDMTDPTGYHRPAHRAAEGRIGAVVKSSSSPGSITLRASAPGLRPASLKLRSR